MRHTCGLESEKFIIDDKGNVAAKANPFIRTYRELFDLKLGKEPGKSIIEFNSEPSTGIKGTFLDYLTKLSKVVLHMPSESHALYPFSTLPHEHKPKMRKKNWYRLQTRIFGSKMNISGMVAGFHFHVSLPEKSFDHRKKSIRSSIHDSVLLSGKNMLIAMDPALTAFTQSSPFFNGKNLAKDSRMLVYRGHNLDFDGLYSSLPILGALQGYAYTINDIFDIAEKRYNSFVSSLPGLDQLKIKNMNIGWNPIRINRIGTFEQRGMDSNLPSYELAAAELIDSAILRIYEQNINVVPHDIGTKEPFKLEQNDLYVPTQDFLQRRLQNSSARLGLEDDIVFDYCKRLVKFAKPLNAAKKIFDMLDSRKTMSDVILEKAKKLGWEKDTLIKKEQSRQLGLWSARLLRKDIDIASSLVKS